MRHHRTQHQDQIPADHEDGDPGGDQMNQRQRDEPGGQEQLVSQGVQHGPQLRMLIRDTGDRPIERVSDARHNQHDQRLIEPLIDQQPDVAGNQEDPDDGQTVGDIHTFQGRFSPLAGGE